MRPIPQFAMEVTDPGDAFYTWGPKVLLPRIVWKSGHRHALALTHSTAKALGVFAIFGASLACQTYFDYPENNLRDELVLIFLSCSYTCFLVSIFLCLRLQFLPNKREDRLSSVLAVIFSALGGLFLSLALFIDLGQVTARFVVGIEAALLVLLLLSVPARTFGGIYLRFLVERARPIMSNVSKCLGLPPPNPGRQEQPHLAIEMQPAQQDTDREDAAFFLTTYNMHKGAVEFLEKHSPAWSKASIEERPILICDLYNAFLPTCRWNVINSRDDVPTLLLRFLELSERWSPVVSKMGLQPLGTVRSGINEYLARESMVLRLLKLEKILKPDNYVPSSASKLDPAREPAARPFSDRTTSMSSEGAGRTPSATHARAHLGTSAGNLSAATRNHGSVIVAGRLPGGDGGNAGEVRIPGAPRGRGEDVSAASAPEVARPAAQGPRIPDIVMAESSLAGDGGDAAAPEALVQGRPEGSARV